MPPKAGIVLLAALTYPLFAQPEARPKFQVASVKLNTTADPRSRGIRPAPGGRLSTENAPLLLLIENAYGVQAYQVIGGPTWISADGYDIEAKPDGAASAPEMWLMLQSLLADRFHLALHHETRDVPEYTLAAAKGGFHPPAPKEDDCAGSCGRVTIAITASGVTMEGRKIAIAELCRILKVALGHPVIDQTGFDQLFDLHFAFTPDESTEGLPIGGPGQPAPASDTTRPSLFAALQELGLKLAASKGPVDVVVIDRVERPSAN